MMRKVFFLSIVLVLSVILCANTFELVLKGTFDYKLTYDEWMKLTSCMYHTKRITLELKGVEHTFDVVPLYVLAAIVDEEKEKHPYKFDEKLWEKGYDITITASDGYTVTFNTKDVKPDDVFIAYRMDGENTLRIVGNIPKQYWVKDPVEIIFDIPTKKKSAKEKFELEIVGYGKKYTFTIDELEKSKYYVEGYGGYKTSVGSIRKAVYSGVKFFDLLKDLFPGIYEKTSIRITAMDGYMMDYDMKEFMDEKDSVWILAFKKDGEYMPYDPGYIRIVKIGMKKDVCPIIDGHSSVRMVKKIEIIEKKYKDFELRIQGYMDWTLDRKDIMSGLSCHGVKVRYMEKDGTINEYYGIPLWMFLAFSDDPKYAPHRQDPSIISYNEDLAKKGYKIRIVAKDGYNITIDSKDVNKNDKVILAVMKNGKDLTGLEFPLTLVWNNTDGYRIDGIKKVKGVVLIKLVFEK